MHEAVMRGSITNTRYNILTNNGEMMVGRSRRWFRRCLRIYYYFGRLIDCGSHSKKSNTNSNGFEDVVHIDHCIVYNFKITFFMISKCST